MERPVPDPRTLTREQLEELIDHHFRSYWERGVSEISDDVYDALIEALRRLDPDHPLLSRIGSTPIASGGGKVRHAEPMLSLDKAYSLPAVLEWAHKFARSPEEPLLVEPKYDGISARFDGRVLSTRGDGAEGEDITSKLPLVELETTGYTGPVDRPVLGELVLRNDRFAELSVKLTKPDGTPFFKNSRNAVPGILRRDDIRIFQYKEVKLTLADYNLVSIPVVLSQLEARWDALLAQLRALPYPQDGVVVKFADEAFRRSLGNTAHHPRGEIAYKFSNVRKATKLLGVEWSFGKNCLTPVALLEPVDVNGITIKRATLHNVQNVLDMDLMIGDNVIVERAGDVIPYVSERTPGAERRSPLISRCPACETELVRRGPELVCPNSECPETLLQRLLGAVRSLGIEELGEPTLRQIMQKCGVRHLRELFTLQMADMLRLDGFAEKSAKKVLDEIHRARRVEDFRLLAALNIPGIGLNVARQLLTGRTLAELRSMNEEALLKIKENYKNKKKETNTQKNLSAEKKVNPEENKNFSGIGPERAKALFREFSEGRGALDELLEAVEIIHAEPDAPKPTVCFTGKMPEKRSHYEKLAADRGYRPVSDVTKELSLLVAADPTASGGKLDNARKYGVAIQGLDEFLAELGETEPPKEFAPAPGAENFADLDLFSAAAPAPEPEKTAPPAPEDPDDLFPGF